MTEWQDQYNELISDGWQQEDPSPEAANIDRAICNDGRCDNCRYYGLIYYPFVRGASYRAFGVCLECGCFVEF